MSNHIGFIYEYAFESIEKYSVRIMYDPINKNKELLWLHDHDGKYFNFPNQYFLTKHNKRKIAISKMNDLDIENVLDSLVFHPTPHQHIESPIDEHEIRVGGGIINLFQYLFSLRFQLCPFQPTRTAEKNRLIYLFKNSITNNTPVNINELMTVPD